MKDTFYFQHDYHSIRDPKIICLMRKHGMAGYGIYWAIIEKLHEEGGWLKLDFDSIAYELHEQCERITDVIQSFDLFIFNDDSFTSNRVLENLKLREEKSNKAKKSAFTRWNKADIKEVNANAMQSQCDANAIKGKERKGKENIIYSTFYDYQILVAKQYAIDDPLHKFVTEKYLDLIDWLFNKGKYSKKDALGNVIDNKKHSLLGFKNQLTFRDYFELLRITDKNKINLIDLFQDMENWGNPKKRTNVYNTALTFIRNRKI